MNDREREGIMYILGFDIGGTKIEVNLISFGEKNNKNSLLNFQFQDTQHKIKNAQLVAKKRLPTERQLGYRQVLKKLAILSKEVCEESGHALKEIKGIGLSVPGPVHPLSGEISASNSMIMVGHKISKDLKTLLKLRAPVIMENDANCFALAEALCGAGLAYFEETKIPVYQQTSVGVILGSGCGGGIIKGGNILSGKRGGGGEIGHTTLYAEGGHPCYCGRRGCAEQYVSGPALESLMNTRMYSQIDVRPNAKKIFELYKLMDPSALAVVKEYKRNLAVFLGSVSSVLDPHYFVCGGGLSLEDEIYLDLEAEVSKNSYIQNEPAKIYKHKIGDSAGAIGASLLVKQLYEAKI